MEGLLAAWPLGLLSIAIIFLPHLRQPVDQDLARNIILRSTEQSVARKPTKVFPQGNGGSEPHLTGLFLARIVRHTKLRRFPSNIDVIRRILTEFPLRRESKCERFDSVEGLCFNKNGRPREGSPELMAEMERFEPPKVLGDALSGPPPVLSRN